MIDAKDRFGHGFACDDCAFEPTRFAAGDIAGGEVQAALGGSEVPHKVPHRLGFGIFSESQYRREWVHSATADHSNSCLRLH